MIEMSLEIALSIGIHLCETNSEQNQNQTEKKTSYEDYKNNYKRKLEIIILKNKENINNLELEIEELERKIIDIMKVYSIKKYNSSSMNFIYTNKQIINYLMALNSLDGEKIKYYKITIQKLKEQQVFLRKILDKNVQYLSNVSK